MYYKKYILSFIFLCLVVNNVLANVSYSVNSSGVNFTLNNDTASFSGVACVSETGFPKLPMETITFVLPFDADISSIDVNFSNLVTRTLSSVYQVMPAEPIISTNGETIWPSNVDTISGKNEDIYTLNEFFPQEIVKVVSVNKLWKHIIVTVLYYPFSHNPVSGVLIENQSLDFTLTYNSIVTPPTVEPVSSSFIERMNDRLGELVTNTNDSCIVRTNNYYSNGSEEKETYVIVTTYTIQYFSWVLRDFVELKRSQGFNVELITEFDYSDGVIPGGDVSADAIRLWLKNNYIAKNIKHVFLIGNPDPATGCVPMKNTNPVYNRPYDCPTDFYYADLDGDIDAWDADGDGKVAEYLDDFLLGGNGGLDRIAEVSVGRFPLYFQSEIEVAKLDAYLSKVITYSLESNISWRKKCLLATPEIHFAQVPINTSEFCEAIKNDVLIPNNYGYHRVYTKHNMVTVTPESDPCTPEIFTDVWKNNNGFGFVTWLTHGGSTFAGNVFDVAHVSNLDNNNPSVVFMSSCSGARPETINNLAYSNLLNGAIATIGGTRVTWGWDWDIDFKDSPSLPGISYAFSEEIISKEKTFGIALIDLKARINLENMPLNANDTPLYAHSTAWMNYLSLNLYGDPSLSLQDKANKQYTITSSVKNGSEDPHPLWDAEDIYTGGDKVCYGGHIWEAKWWTQGDVPEQAQDSPWDNLGPYNNGHGSITPLGDISVLEGNDFMFTFDPDLGYIVSDIIINGVSIGAHTSYTFLRVLKNYTIEVEFSFVESPVILWNLNRQYYYGDKVLYNDIIWEAKWWSLNVQPTNCAYGPWKLGL